MNSFEVFAKQAGNAPGAGVAVSSTNTYYGEKSSLKTLRHASYDFYWGTNVGTITIQVSNKERPDESSDTDWKTLTLAVAITQPNGSNTGDFVDLSELPAIWVRPKYVNSSGSGTLYGWFFGRS